jgi:curli biogenesis system outer membrane secretion channel CsgG
MHLRRIPVLLLFVAVCGGYLRGCATIPEPQGFRPVAVWDLENLSLDASARPDLGQLLSSEIIQAIKEHGAIQVVERAKLIAILEELKLGSSALADESTRLRVGRMMGAKEMVFGGYMVVGTTMRIDLRRVDVETGRVLKTAKMTADAADLAGYLAAARTAGALLFKE